MTKTEILILPVLMKANFQLNLALTYDDVEVVKVDDTIYYTGPGVPAGGASLYSGEKRCAYDIYTTATDGVRVRAYYRPDEQLLIEDLVLNGYTGEIIVDTRTFYTVNLRVNSDFYGIPYSGASCPELSDVPVQQLNILLQENGNPLLTEGFDFIYLENEI